MNALALYLHGFASSPESSKAVRIAQELEPLGITTRIPDLNQPSFRALTVTRMIGQVRALIDEASSQPVVLIGSSLGAFVAVHAAAADTRVKALVLLAPALDFGADERGQIGTVTIADWKAAGSCEVFHYAWNRPETLDYALFDDARRYDAFGLALDMPVLIFQGRRDTVVDPAVVERWAAGRPNVTLVMVDDDHQLQASLDTIVEQTKAFLASELPE
ncbi:MAG TPA: YqiA/YcfP family alpha/beta fold hydrolase [Vicinamibacterales bacterium]